MKKYWKLMVGAVAFVAFMVVVSVAYKSLSQEYKPQQNLVTQKGQGTEDSPESQKGQAEEDNDASAGVAGSEDTAGAGQEAGEGAQGVNGAGQEANDETTGNTSAESEQATENLAPNFTVETAEGEEVSLHDFFGKPIVLNFWASWCGPCKMELPDFQDAFEKYDGEIEFLMVNMTDGVQETKEIAMKFMEDEGYTLPVYYDTAQDAAYTYTVYSLPTTFFISAEGEPVAYAQGMIDAATLETGISMIYP